MALHLSQNSLSSLKALLSDRIFNIFFHFLDYVALMYKNHVIKRVIKNT